MDSAVVAPLTRSARKRQKQARQETTARKAPASDAPSTDAPEIKSSWIAMGFSLAVHAFLLAVMAVLVVHGASISSEREAVIDGSLGGGGGNAGLGDPFP